MKNVQVAKLVDTFQSNYDKIEEKNNFGGALDHMNEHYLKYNLLNNRFVSDHYKQNLCT